MSCLIILIDDYACTACFTKGEKTGSLFTLSSRLVALTKKDKEKKPSSIDRAFGFRLRDEPETWLNIIKARTGLDYETLGLKECLTSQSEDVAAGYLGILISRCLRLVNVSELNELRILVPFYYLDQKEKSDQRDQENLFKKALSHVKLLLPKNILNIYLLDFHEFCAEEGGINEAETHELKAVLWRSQITSVVFNGPSQNTYCSEAFPGTTDLRGYGVWIEDAICPSRNPCIHFSNQSGISIYQHSLPATNSPKSFMLPSNCKLNISTDTIGRVSVRGGSGNK